MNRILKIVGGPLKGAEIELVAGTRLKVGSGDGCDILVADPTLEKAAFELDVAEDEVTIVTPDGTAKTMLDFEAREFGSSAFAIGPAEGVWQEIVWPEKGEKPEGESKEPDAKAEEGVSDKAQPKADPPGKEKDASPETKDEGKSVSGFRLSRLVFAAVVVILLLLALFCYQWRCRDCCETPCETGAPRVTLEAVASRYGLTVAETNGETRVSGNLKTRAERLQATAAAFQAQPGVELDLMDDESLFESAEALLGLVARGRSLKIAAATNRVVALAGSVGSDEDLRNVLQALAADISGMEKVDCSKVAVPAGEVPAGDLALPVQALPARAVAARGESAPVRAVATRSAIPNLPVCGVMMTPYPCLILKNGTRVSEGGTFGGYAIRRISADSLTLSDGERTFEWKP